MATSLPVLKTYTEKINIDKMKYIANTNKRSLARELEYIVEKHIETYEAEHGPIEIDQGGVKPIRRKPGRRKLKRVLALCRYPVV